MRKFKLIDFWTQIILATANLMLLFWKIEMVLLGWLLVVGWQVVSTIVHELFKTRFFAAHTRKYYIITLLSIFVISFILWPLYGPVLLIAFPFLIIWYSTICYTENKLLEYKSVIHLK